MDKVAEPFPALASTTSVPPSCVLLVRALMSSSDNELVAGVAYFKGKPPRIRFLKLYLKIKAHCLAMASIPWFTMDKRKLARGKLYSYSYSY
jgi:hypothetical protein